MGTAKRGSAGGGRRAAGAAQAPPARVRKNMDMDPDKLRRARRVLGTKTDTETVDAALDRVLFQREFEQALERVAAAGGVADIYAPAVKP